MTATRTDKLGRVRTINACVLPLVREEQEGFVPLEGEYAPSTQEWVRTGVDNYERLHGFDVSFGIIDRDRNVRPNAAVLSSEALQ